MKAFVLQAHRSHPPSPVFHGEYFSHTLLVTEANRTKEKPENQVKASTGQGARTTATSSPGGVGLVRVGFIEAVGEVWKGLPVGRASKESGGVRRAWGPKGGGLGCRLEWAELVLLVLQSLLGSQMRKGRQGAGRAVAQPPQPSGPNLPEALLGSSHPSWAEALETPWSSTLEPYPGCPALPPTAPDACTSSGPRQSLCFPEAPQTSLQSTAPCCRCLLAL